MKKLKLPQPYASMVIAGTLQTLPNVWRNVKYGEKIFIYADDMDKELRDGLDYTKPLHRKIYNESFLGNISDDDFPTQKFIGYVRVYHTGVVQEGWIKNQQSSLFVTCPHKLNTFIEGFNCDDNYLDNAPSRQVTLRAIERKGAELYVPVGKSIWQRLKDPEECVGVCMFWESYMNAFSNAYFSLGNEDIEDITDIHFKYNKNSISFLTDGYVGELPAPEYSTGELVSLLSFNLCYRNLGSTLKEVGAYRKEENPTLNKGGNHLESNIQETEKEVEEKRKEYRPYIRFISTPMGGMTRWKR